MAKVLFVCTGNTCRSPMAEYMMKEMISENKKNWDILSAGIQALIGTEASQNAQRVLKEEGIDLTDHRAQQIDDSLIEDSDLVLTMTSRHRDMLIRMYPENKKKIFTLKEFQGENDDIDIIDPFGQDLDVYRQTKDEIKDILEKIIGKMEHFIENEGDRENIENNLK